MGKNKKQQNFKKWLRFLLFGGILAKFFAWLFNTKRISNFVDNFDDFVSEEKKEVDKLFSQDETVGEFIEGSGSVFKDFFIPSNSNSYKPKILRPKSLLITILVLIAIKACVLGYLFWLYPNQAQMSEQIVNQVLELTNQSRIANNLVPYQLNYDLSVAALAKANDMIENGYFAHHSPDGRKPWDWINRDNYRYLLVGENLAMNFSAANSAHQALMDSESHRKNILNDKYSDIGLAVVTGEINGQTTNILVELFAVEQEPILATTEESPSIPMPVAELEEIEQIEIEDMENEIAVLSAEETVPLITKAPEEIISEPQPIQRQVKLSPNLLLETEPNEEVEWHAITSYSKEGWAAKVVTWSKYIYLVVLAIITIALLINILIRITVQHKSVIIQSILVIIFISGMLLIRVHILESILDQIALI